MTTPLARTTRAAAAAAAAAVLVALLAVGASSATAQLPRTKITGSAVSATGERVVGAQVRVVGSPMHGAVTSDDGDFELFVLNDSLPRLVVRRIGFRPETVLVRMPQPATPALVVRMTRAIQMVKPVVVSATSGESNTILATVRERQRTGGNGHFAFRGEFMRHNPAKFSDILRRIPGVSINRTDRSAMSIRLRNARCAPLYWIDGQPLLGIPFDPDNVPPGTVEAIEIYSGASLVPPQFQGPQSAQGCGAIVIWTRQGERPVRRSKIDADSMVRLLDAHRIFVATEVDEPARVVALQEPEYPDSLRALGVGGSAVIEFIIEADGKLNKESIGVVSATHMKFADAVRFAVLDGVFTPARKAERPVAQIYQLPVTFTAPQRP